MYYFDDEIVKNYVLNSIKSKTTKTEEYSDTMNNFIRVPEQTQSAHEKELVRIAFEELKNSKPQSEEMNVSFLMNMVSQLTSTLPMTTKAASFLTLKKGGVLKKYYPVKDGFYLETPNGTSVEIQAISKVYKGIDKQIKGLTNFNERLQTCHEYSPLLIRLLDGDVDLVTGYIQALNFKYLHTWVETKGSDPNGGVVFDVTINAIMPKKDYYKIKKAEAVSRLSKQQVDDMFSSDYYGPGKPLEGIKIKELLLWPREIFDLLNEMYGIKIESLQTPKEKEMQ